MTNRFFLLVAGAFLLVFAIGVGAVVGITSMTDRVTIADDVPSKAATPAVAPAPTFAAFSPEVQVRPASLETAGSLVRTAPLSVVVGPADINRLASAVHLSDASSGVSKEIWNAQLPVAQKLLGGMCDCDQRNWLNHFVETGQEAVSGSRHYAESIQLLAKLRRANDDLARSSISQ